VTRRLVFLTGVLLVATTSAAVGFRAAPPSSSILTAHVIALTAPEMEGRASGTVGAERAARYIVDRFAAADLRPGGERGTFLQSFVIGSTVRLGPGSSLRRLGAGPARFEAGRDWMPHGGSRRGTVKGELVFAGSGVSASGHDDYAGLEVTGRVVLVLDGAPPHWSGPPPSRLDKLIAARRRGAVALLIAGDGLPTLEATSAPVNLVSGALAAATTDALLAPSGLTRAALAQHVAESRAPASLATGVEVELHVDLQADEVRTTNVIGVVPGHDPTRASEAMVVGAHYDHLGRSGGAVYPGADDNASGTAVVLELARAFATAGGVSRTLVFVLFSGEEIGLLGSRHYVRNPTVPIERTVAMINFDMVGRLGDRPLGVGGVATGGGLKTVVDDAGRQLGIRLADRDAPGGASDHAPFYNAGVPVLFFHTGAHPDYHRPTDTADKIDTDGLARVAAVAARVIEDVAGRPRPTYVALPAPPPRAAGAPTPRGVAFLGVSPARAGLSDGVQLGAVVPDGAAARAGMREGDIIIRLGEVPVQSFDELRAALQVRRPGDPVQVVYLRDGEDRTAQAVLGERP
jgi:Peptidase family M28/PDZ domain